MRLNLTSVPLSKAAVVLNQATVSANNLLVSFYLLKLIGVPQFGEFALIYAAAYSISIACNALITQPMATLAATREASDGRAVINSASIITLLIVGGLLTGAAFGLTWPSERQFITGPSAVLLLASTNVLSEFARRVCFLEGKIHQVWQIDIVKYTVQWLLLGILYLFSIESGVVAGYVLGVAGILSLLLIPRNWKRLRSVTKSVKCSTGAGKLKNILTPGSWLMASAILQMANDQLFLFIGAVSIDTTSIGVIRACQVLVSIVNPLIISLEYILPRAIGNKIAQVGRREASSYYVLTSAVVSVLCAILLIFIFLIGPSILLILVGEQVRLESVSQILFLYCLIWQLNCITVLLSIGLRANGTTSQIFYSQLIAGVISVVICFPVTVNLGMIGIPIGSLVAQTIVVASMMGFSRGKILALPKNNPDRIR